MSDDLCLDNETSRGSNISHRFFCGCLTISVSRSIVFVHASGRDAVDDSSQNADGESVDRRHGGSGEVGGGDARPQSRQQGAGGGAQSGGLISGEEGRRNDNDHSELVVGWLDKTTQRACFSGPVRC